MIYIAATYGSAPLIRERKQELIEAGFPVSSSWCDGYFEKAPNELAARVDLTEVMAASVLILDLDYRPEMTPGKMTEYGIALATGADILVVGDRSKYEENVLMSLADHWLETWAYTHKLHDYLDMMSVERYGVDPGEFHAIDR